MSKSKCQINGNKRLPAAGFTLLEVVMTVAIFAAIAYGLLALVSGVITSSSRNDRLLSDEDQARRLAFNLSSELRHASNGATGGYPLNLAGSTQLVFFSNIDSSSDIEQVRYYLQAEKLYKGVTKPSGQPIGYNPSQETLSVVQNNVVNTSTPVFYYYNDSYNGTVDSPLSQPVNITQVKLVKIELRIRNVGGQAQTNFYTITASAAVRNLKSNLGN